MERKNLIGSAPKVIGAVGLVQLRAASRRGIRLAPLLLVAVMLAAVAVLAETSNPAQTAHAHEGDDHTHRCSEPAGRKVPRVWRPLPRRGSTVWSATMNAGFVYEDHGHRPRYRGGTTKARFTRASNDPTSEFTFENQYIRGHGPNLR